LVYELIDYIYPFCPSIHSDSWLHKWREHFLARFINPVRSKYEQPPFSITRITVLCLQKMVLKHTKKISYLKFLCKTECLNSNVCDQLAPSQLHLNFINESKHRQLICRGGLSYSDIYIGKGSLWFRYLFMLPSFLLCPTKKSRASY
jgi:hypothetical protein